MNKYPPAFPSAGGMFFYIPKELEEVTRRAADELSKSCRGGVTVLDYFAGQAIGNSELIYATGAFWKEAVAKEAYDIATAMLAEKQRREGSADA